MLTDLLIVGIATDGPSNQVFQPSSLRELGMYFGEIYKESIFVSSTATSLTTLYEPYTIPVNIINNKSNQLYSPYISGSVMYFGNIGGSGSTEVLLEYTPYLGKSDLIFASKYYFRQTGRLPYVCRIGGTTSLATIDSWEFESKYAGAKYNNIRLIITPTSFTVSGMYPEYKTRTYNVSSVETLNAVINREFAAGIIPITVAIKGSTYPTSGTYSMTGGTDGSFSDADVQKLLQNSSLPQNVSHVLLNTPLSSGIVDHVTDFLSTEGSQPRMFLTAAPVYSGTATGWINAQITNIPFRSNMIASFVGTVDINTALIRRERYAAEAGAVAFVANTGFNMTNIPVAVDSFSPILSKDDLARMVSTGWIPLVRHIKNNISVYQGTTSFAENSFLYSSKLAEVMAIAQNECSQYLGVIVPDGQRVEIERKLRDRLLQIKYLTVTSVSVRVLRNEMFVEIVGDLPYEILRISFTVNVK